MAGAIVSLVLLSGTATWKMFQFRDRLHAFWVNPHWEQRLEQWGMYQDRVIVFFGDSQLAGWRVGPSFGMLPIRNRGISGDQASRAIHRFQRDVTDEGATLAVILIGINDLGRETGATPESVAASIDQLVQRALENEIEIMLCSLLPLQRPYYSPHRAEQVLAINKWMAERENVTYIDFHSVLMDEEGRMKTEYTDDGLHPNERGYAVMTRILQPHLARHLAKGGGNG